MTAEDRRRFLLEYIDLLLVDDQDEPSGFRHLAPSKAGTDASASIGRAPARGRDRWVVNKLRALCAWYSKGLDGGSHLRIRVNQAESIAELREVIEAFFDPALAVAGTP